MDQKTTALTLPDEQTFKGDIQAINKFQQIVRANLLEDQDYGVIPGTTKPTLLKPGAEKIAKLLGLSDQYEILDRQEDWSKPFFRYLIKCSLISVSNGVIVCEGLGECNSMEVKYRWRETKRICPTCGAEAIIKGKEQYGGGWICFKKIGGCGAKWDDGAEAIVKQKVGRVENEEIFDQVNTILKMAKKRSLVDAALSAGRLSNIFTQDMEDIGARGGEEPPGKKAATTKKPSKKDAKDLFPEDPPHAAAAAQAAEKAAEQRVAEAPPSEEAGAIDPDWLKENLPKVKWTEKTAATWLVSKFKVQGGLLKDVLASLTPEQREEFVREIEDRLSMA